MALPTNMIRGTVAQGGKVEPIKSFLVWEITVRRSPTNSGSWLQLSTTLQFLSTMGQVNWLGENYVCFAMHDLIFHLIVTSYLYCQLHSLCNIIRIIFWTINDTFNHSMHPVGGCGDLQRARCFRTVFCRLKKITHGEEPRAMKRHDGQRCLIPLWNPSPMAGTLPFCSLDHQPLQSQMIFIQIPNQPISAFCRGSCFWNGHKVSFSWWERESS